METTYESIKSLIVTEEWTENRVALKFKAKNQEQPIETMGMAMPSQEEIMKKIAIETAKSAAASTAINTGANALGALTGIGGAGGLISSAANQAGVGYQMDMAKIMQVEMTDAVKQQTVLNAFMGLAAYYHFENGDWVYKA
ncbi:MAG: hypothetical protein IAF38_20950 [Bacteroidia bacterium]|nr:hypothetical protein [Bacteroidia bacterium]